MMKKSVILASTVYTVNTFYKGILHPTALSWDKKNFPIVVCY